MLLSRTTLATALLAATLAVSAQTPPQAESANKSKSMQELLDASKSGDWRTLDPARTLYMDLATGRVVIELAPEFAPAHVANIRAMAKAGYWNGLSINRSQDNFVVQWGDPAEDEGTRKPLPKTAKAKLPAEFTRSSKNIPFTPLPDVDGWARQVGFSDGFPIGLDTTTAPPGWPTATAWSAPAATLRPIPAPVPSCTWSPASRRASSTATSPASAASCRAWSC